MLLLGILPPALLILLAKFDRKYDLPNPLRVVAWVLIFGYTLKSLYLPYAIGRGLPFITDHFTRNYIPLGQFAVLLATLCFAFGYMLTGRTRLHTRSFKGNVPRKLGTLLYWPVFVLAITGVALVFYLKGLYLQILNLQFAGVKFFVDEEGNKSSLGFLLLGSDLLLVYFLYYLAFGRGLLRPNVYLPAIVFVSLNFFLSSQRTGVLIIIIGAILVGRVGFFKFTSKTALKRLTFVGLTLAILSMASYIRNESNDVSASDLSISAGIEITLTQTFYGTYAIDPAKLTGIILHEHSYLLGQSFLMFIIAPIPKILWPEKPPVRLGPYVAQELLDYNNESGSPPSAIGEFYINFSWLGVVLGMFFLGALACLVRNTVAMSRFGEFNRVRYALFLLILIDFLIGDFSYAILFVIKYGFADWVCSSYWLRKFKQSAHDTYEDELLVGARRTA